MENVALLSTSNTETITIPRAAYEDLIAELQRKSVLLQNANDQIKWLLEQLEVIRKNKFGSSSEKMGNVFMDQTNLFHEEETEAVQEQTDTSTDEGTIMVPAHTRKKRSGSVKDILPDNVEEEIVEHTLPEDKRKCPDCGSTMQPIGKEERLELKLIPARAVLVRNIYYTYACENCKATADKTPIVKTPREPQVIPGSFTSPETIAHIMVQDAVMGSPLYRQEHEWNRMGVMISRQDMSNWSLEAAKSWLEPIYERLHQLLLEHDILHADDTSLQVLREPDKPAQSKSYMWVYRTSGDAEHPIVLYVYRDNHKGSTVVDFLKGWNGWLHCDGLSVYNGLPDSIIKVGCLAHGRRKFFDAITAAAKHNDQEHAAAKKGLAYFQRLFNIEKELADLPPKDRQTQRQEREKPVFDALLAWSDTISAAPKSSLGGALYYLKAHWTEMTRYLDDGRLEQTNSRAERSIKPFVMARKNFLFANTPNGAKATAIIFSMTETAKENGLDPYRYLTYIFTNAPILKKDDPDWVEKFLPENVPDSCRV